MSLFNLKIGNRFSVSVETIRGGITLPQYIQSKIDHGEDIEEPFYVVDLGQLVKLHAEWERALPRVRPFYAVKCNEDPALLKTLAALGTGFDCASKAEINTMLELGVAPDCIIYANPCKQVSHLKYAARKGVTTMTFDNELELLKVKSHFPSAKLVLRIRADDPNAVCQLGIKFGCSLSDGRELLNMARKLDLNVVGISFHVGSGCQTPSAYQDALAMCADMFHYGASIGYNFTLLDIGGGYPGEKGSEKLFEKVTNAINQALSEHFNSSRYPNLDIIAEPGRYFACSTHALAVNVFSKRVVNAEDSKPSYMYYVNDGIYGSFNCIMFDHYTVVPTLLQARSPARLFPTSFWGPTCDGLDKICDTHFPELNLGDYVYFDNMGAYTVSASSSFNGFQRPKSFYYVTEDYMERFATLLPLSLVERPKEAEDQQTVCESVSDPGSPSPSPSPVPCDAADQMEDIKIGMDSFGLPLVKVC